MKSATPNEVWANTFAEELALSGLKQVCISPGSRSAPLVMAFARLPNIQKFVLYDERSAAYFALGLAMASGVPAAVVVTSGTAVANLYPAVVEANRAEIPLLVLTADRPHELRESGSNQTIDQIKIFGDQVRWFVDIAPPESQPPPLVIRSLRTLAARALDRTSKPLAGPVHLNFPFRKPLEPNLETWNSEGKGKSGSGVGAPSGDRPRVRISRGDEAPSAEMVEHLAGAIRKHKKGWIICGPRSYLDVSPDTLAALAAFTGFPMLCDSLSGMRFGGHTSNPDVLLVTAYEWFLGNTWRLSVEAPELILQVGWPPVSGQLQRHMGDFENVTWYALNGSGSWRYPEFGPNELMISDPEKLIRETLIDLEEDHWSPDRDDPWRQKHQAAEARAWKEIEANILPLELEGPLVHDILAIMPGRNSLFVGNSLPVRHLDEFGQVSKKPISVFANRGASGIDGNISTAAGIAAGSGVHLVAVIGDLAAIHDMAGLMAIRRYAPNTTLVVINNRGGGIFRRLPISSFEHELIEYFVAPHEFHPSNSAKIFGLRHASHQRRDEFRATLARALRDPEPYLIEFGTDAAKFEEVRQAIRRSIAAQI